MARDMTKGQFREACKRHGFKPAGFMGYYELSGGVSASLFNAGKRRRDQLAYLIRENEKWKAKRKAEGKTT